MHFFRDCRASSVLESSCTYRTLRFYERCFGALIARTACMLFSPNAPTVGAGTKTVAEKLLFLEVPNR